MVIRAFPEIKNLGILKKYATTLPKNWWLLSKLSIEDLKELEGAHETRNAYIARILREYGYVRELGEGIRRMFETMKTHELRLPQITSPNSSFVVILFHKGD